MDEPTNPADAFKAEVGSEAQPAKANVEPVAPEEPIKVEEQPKPNVEAGPEPVKEPKEEPKEPVKEPEPAKEPNPPQEHDWKKRYDGTAKSLKDKSEEYDRVIATNVSLVQKNPDMLDIIAEADKDMAEDIARKLYGATYEDHKASKRIAELREEDPDRADTEERLLNSESTLRNIKDNAKAKFLESKEIMNNKFDPSYIKWKAQMDILNPTYVSENYDRACELAHGLAFPQGYSAEDLKKAQDDAVLAAQASKGGGGAPNEGGPSKRPMSPEAKGFNDKFSDMANN